MATISGVGSRDRHADRPLSGWGGNLYTADGFDSEGTVEIRVVGPAWGEDLDRLQPVGQGDWVVGLKYVHQIAVQGEPGHLGAVPVMIADPPCGVAGMEIPWGGPQVFGAVEQWLEDEPDANFYVSPTWANGVDTLQQFFLPAGAPVGIANADRFTEQRQPLTDQTILVLTAREYEQALMDPKLADVRVEKLIPYPDGSPGFYFVRMRYSDQADALFEQERQRRLMPVIDTLEVRGETLTIEHPLLDSGGVQHIFDGDPYTLARGYDANPMLLKITFGAPRPLTGIDITTGSMDFALTIRLFPADGGAPAVYSGTYRDLPDDPTVSMDFPGAPDAVSRIELEIQHLLEPGPAKIHLREIRFR